MNAKRYHLIDGVLIPVISGGDPTATDLEDDVPGLTTYDRIMAMRQAALDELETLVTPPEGQETRAQLTETESQRFDELVQRVEDLNTRAITVRQQQLADQRLGDLDQLIRPESRDRTRISVTREPRTYDQHPGRYLRDFVMGPRGDQQAMERLQRHRDEMVVEQRDVGRSTDAEIGYFVPPLYAIDDFAEVARAGRPFADAIGSKPLPAGVDSVKIPRITTGTKVAVQNGDNAAITTRDVVTAETTSNLVTIGGYIDVGVQALDTAPVDIQDIMFQDLMSDYAMQLDTQMWSGTGTNGELIGVLNLENTNGTTYTDSTPTFAELWPKIGETIAEIHTTRFLPAQLGFIHPTRWHWLASRLDSNNRPLAGITQSFPQNVASYVENVVAEGRGGMMQGLPWILDANLPTTLGTGTNEDRIVAARITDARLWEGIFRTEVVPVADATSETLTVRLKLWRYVIFLPGRHTTSWSILSGTGLSTPTF